RVGGVGSGEFKLPSTAANGEYVLTVTEATERCPAVLRRLWVGPPASAGSTDNSLQVEFFPEGGDLVAGVSQRVYFLAHSAAGRPVTLVGKLPASGKRLIAEVRTESFVGASDLAQGLGSFQFTPQAGETYQVQVTTPAQSGLFPLPGVSTATANLHIP